MDQNRMGSNEQKINQKEMPLKGKFNFHCRVLLYVPHGLARCCSFSPSSLINAGHRHWLWSVERYLVSQMSPTPERTTF